ncbi:Phage integrase family protein [Fibrobacter intestinalis]|uniref:Phage integrase family protein n=1 Tax=Fibrobacter intestinalis TaxID=28122 RepID=A0A1T4M543_9BACT|nr:MULTISPECIES: site-specific integrase [Fibrobacter]PBC73457.1 phage integrase family protein [Fibrobacter sp. NR9]SJZ62042.1 Phage integrase family protein [Fibrobacter intestinalis]
MRFKEAAERWFEKKCASWSESSRAKYENILRKHLLPYFGEVELVGFDSALVRDFAERALGELAVSTRRFVLATLQQILKSALSPEDLGALDFPHAGTTRKGEAVPLSPEELAALIRALEKNENPKLENSARSLLLIAFTGMRLGEVCALKFSDFDFVRNTIKIHGTLERLPNDKGKTAKGADENAAAEMENAKPPKTVRKLCPPKSESGHREIPIPENLLQWLKKNGEGKFPGQFSGEARPADIAEPLQALPENRRGCGNERSCVTAYLRHPRADFRGGPENPLGDPRPCQHPHDSRPLRSPDFREQAARAGGVLEIREEPEAGAKSKRAKKL